MPPIRVMMTDSTVAKIGRSMKNREITLIVPHFLVALVGTASSTGGGPSDGIVTCSAWTVIRGRICCKPPTTTQSSGFNPSLMTRRPSSWSAPDANPPVLHLVLAIEDVDVLEPLVGRDGTVDHQEGGVRFADRQPDANEHAGLEPADPALGLGLAKMPRTEMLPVVGLT